MRVSAGALLAACAAAQTAAFVAQRHSTHGLINTTREHGKRQNRSHLTSLRLSEGNDDSEWLQSTLSNLSLEEETRRAEENLKSWGKMLELLGEATEDDPGSERSMYKLSDAPSTSTSLKASSRQEPELRYSAAPKTRLQTPRPTAQSPSAFQSSSQTDSNGDRPGKNGKSNKNSAPQRIPAPRSNPSGSSGALGAKPAPARASMTTSRPSSSATAVLEAPPRGSYSAAPDELPFQVRKATPTLNAVPLNALDETRLEARRRIYQPANAMPDPTTLEVIPPSRMVSKPVRAKSPSSITRRTPWEEGEDTRWEEGVRFRLDWKHPSRECLCDTHIFVLSFPLLV